MTPAGGAFIVNPDEPHTGESATGETYMLQTLYVEPAALADLTSDLGSRPHVPAFREAVIRNDRLASLLARCHDAIRSKAAAMECETLALEVLASLVKAYGNNSSDDRAGRRESSKVRAARDYIEERFAEDISLSDLAVLVSLNPYYFARAFERECGLPPHAYLENVRIRQACRLLEGGENVAMVAPLVGYSDQPHLTRRFKRFLGITPAAYKRAFHGIPRAE